MKAIKRFFIGLAAGVLLSLSAYVLGAVAMLILGADLLPFLEFTARPALAFLFVVSIISAVVAVLSPDLI